MVRSEANAFRSLFAIMALSLLIPPAELRELDYTTEAPMGNPEYTACLCGHPVKDCKCKPIPVHTLYEFPRVNLDAANAFANGSYDLFAESATVAAFVKEAKEECPNCGLFQCYCVFDGYDDQGNIVPLEYCYSCKSYCMECDCYDFADALLTHSSTASHSVSSFYSLQKAYESMGLLPATGWAAELDAELEAELDAELEAELDAELEAELDAAVADVSPVVDTICDPFNPFIN